MTNDEVWVTQEYPVSNDQNRTEPISHWLFAHCRSGFVIHHLVNAVQYAQTNTPHERASVLKVRNKKRPGSGRLGGAPAQAIGASFWPRQGQRGQGANDECGTVKDESEKRSCSTMNYPRSAFLLRGSKTRVPRARVGSKAMTVLCPTIAQSNAARDTLHTHWRTLQTTLATNTHLQLVRDLCCHGSGRTSRQPFDGESKGCATAKCSSNDRDMMVLR